MGEMDCLIQNFGTAGEVAELQLRLLRFFVYLPDNGKGVTWAKATNSGKGD